jgi:GT2 family glycosyltransferase
MVNGFKSSEIGSVACKMLNFFDRQIIDDTGISIKLIGLPHPRGSGEIDLGQYDNEEYILGACGGAVIYKKYIFNDVGFFDEDFISYLEDVDFSFRLQEKGYRCLYNPKAICYHKRGGTANLNSPYRSYLCEKNLVAVRLMHYPLWSLLMLSPIYFLARIKRYFLSIFQRSPKESLFATLGYINGLLGFFGYLGKRINFRKNKTVTDEYILGLFK